MDRSAESESTITSQQHVKTRLVRVVQGVASAQDDFLVVEEPLEIAIRQNGDVHTLSVTLRTPGDDEALAIGFLLGEGVIRKASDVSSVRYKEESNATIPAQRIIVTLEDHVCVDLESLRRNFPISAACGACGKSALEALKVFREKPFAMGSEKVSNITIQELPVTLEAAQKSFEKTGGLHAAARFDLHGNLLAVAEDIGRHNALDKLVGKMALENLEADWKDSILLFSGRVGYDLMQKAIGVGCPFVVSVGAPSSLAVELANLFKLTLIGFLREGRFNVYSCPDRLQNAEA